LSVTFPRLSEAGRWTLSSLFLADAAGNTLVLDTQGLTALGMRTSLEVKSTADTKSPTLTSLRFNPEEIDTSQGPATVKVDFSAADDLSGVKSLEVVFVSPSGSLRRSGSTLFTPATQVTDSLNVSFPAFTESGPWTVSTVLVADAAGNTLLLDESELGRLGLRPLRVGSTRDETPPKLIALRCNPDTIDTTEGPVTVTVEFTATDDSSGVKSAEVVLESPSGKVRQSGSAVFVPSKEVNGVMQVTFQRLSEPGAWKVGAVTLADMAGNTLILDKYAMPSRVLQVR
jgi:hypothetical protein